MKRFLNFLTIFLLLAFISCSKNDKQQTDKSTRQEKQQDESENPGDTLMSPEEKFSSSITIDFLDAPDDEDLTNYLEEELFKYSKTYRGASVMQLSNAVWFVSLENNSSTKNFLLQKFVDFNSNDYYFVLKETTLNVSDVIASANMYRSSTNNKSKETQQTQTSK